ncbi:MAG: hypothetical protein JSR61_02615 [Proteobacteria bacterium]|nr:hypothetical protein [Pseudomonadota bacterium]
MSGNLIELTGPRAPKKPADAAPAVPDLNDPRYWLEPAVAPSFVSNLRPRVTVAGGLATIMVAVIEHSLPFDSGRTDPGATVQAKIVVPEGLLQEFAIALAQAAGARLVEQAEGGPGDETH